MSARREHLPSLPKIGRLLIIATSGAVLAIGMPATAQAQNLTYGEIKLGILDHDTHLLEGKEHGLDFNPELIGPSPITDSWMATVPWYFQWMVQPKPTLGAEFNTSGYTNQYYFGATWSWMLTRNVLKPDDGVVFSLFFGPSFNDGETVAKKTDRKSLGSNVLFREAFELGYQITPVWQISLFLDHTSNAGLARYNQSINDLGARIGFRF
jgi:lipid A 3-O-deacylase